uniref:Ribonucleoprotein n=1 Tax=virus sp. ctrcb4 TaxID=2825824 RepID=A0A8S5RPN1_9VIRU|nr:MAG TPA: ribonucleoprotein [virus sp. ctrcb4]
MSSDHELSKTISSELLSPWVVLYTSLLFVILVL